MNRKLFFMTVVCLLLVCISATVVIAEEGPSKNATTKAFIKFTDGDLEFDDSALGEFENMDIDFGEHELPIGPSNYKAADNDHTLRVFDGRSNAGDWNVTVKMTKFEHSVDSTKSFVGTIDLADPQFETLTNVVTVLSADPLISILSGDNNDKTVVVAAIDAHRGYFDTTWLQNNISLDITEPETLKIKADGVYTAKLYWTLNNT